MTFCLPSNINKCILPDYKMKINEKELKVIVAKLPFSQGVLRLAYHGIDEYGKRVVLKLLKRMGWEEMGLKRYLEAIECQTVAYKFAQEFSIVNNDNNKIIKYTVARVAQVKNSAGTFFTIESYIDGEYEKFNNNSGWRNNDMSLEILKTFSHWTHHLSKGQ
ncbi:hypothetical protein SAMD00019534_028230 [Acytostelium subglobosum LB1]|uniref:hypothetical protein n=1 Tax=Acytostelium subglobosum LB1 TaxID=1410327 RepID=UPI000644EA89|nr:hypothetical protein SAMD00019534_028230 [Acytostelium subglobosum LB1]GAM19648.1 hypothetical protein SAMD00019534_028230 [Acytostelium subglobosum LB1]|eukprot:XP_012756410.1 hypothetical protein SAMD00019534_028230 [Acytostelium subglobosum LB1]